MGAGGTMAHDISTSPFSFPSLPMNISNSLSNSSAVLSFLGSRTRGALVRAPRRAPRAAGRVRVGLESNLGGKWVREHQTLPEIKFTKPQVPLVDLLKKVAREEVASVPC